MSVTGVLNDQGVLTYASPGRRQALPAELILHREGWALEDGGRRGARRAGNRQQGRDREGGEGGERGAVAFAWVNGSMHLITPFEAVVDRCCAWRSGADADPPGSSCVAAR